MLNIFAIMSNWIPQSSSLSHFWYQYVIYQSLYRFLQNLIYYYAQHFLLFDQVVQLICKGLLIFYQDLLLSHRFFYQVCWNFVDYFHRKLLFSGQYYQVFLLWIFYEYQLFSRSIYLKTNWWALNFFFRR